MKALVTGHVGFVGQHVTRRLEDDGWEVYGCDIADGRDARDLFRVDQTHFDLVVHLAAVVGGRRTIEGQPLAVAVDLSIDAELFQWALRTRPSRIVYYSSSAAYPVRLQTDLAGKLARRLRETDINLDSVSTPDMTYGWAKLTGELLARHAQDQGLRVHVFRPFSGYGDGQTLDYPFPTFIARALARHDPFVVWGDGGQVRDFIHIDDVVAATMAALDQDVAGPVNLGWGRPTSFNQLADLVSQQVGYTPRVEHREQAPVGVRYRVANPDRMLSFYQPTVALEEGIRRALA